MWETPYHEPTIWGLGIPPTKIVILGMVCLVPTALLTTPPDLPIFLAASSACLSFSGLVMHSVCRVGGWGGRGWCGGVWCGIKVSLARPHICDASYCAFSCTCTHTSCYATVCSCALPHVRHATLLYVLLHVHTCDARLLYVLAHFHTYVMLRYCAAGCFWI